MTGKRRRRQEQKNEEIGKDEAERQNPEALEGETNIISGETLERHLLEIMMRISI